MVLRIIHGGRKDGDGPKRPKSSTMETYAQALLQALSAPSRFEIAKRMSKTLRREISIPMVDKTLAYARRNNAALGWMPHYAKNGPNPLKEDRFVVVVPRRDGTFHTDAEQDVIHDGTVATLHIIKTRSERLHDMVLAVSTHIPGRKRPRLLRGLALDLEFVANKITAALEEIDDEANGAA